MRRKRKRRLRACLSKAVYRDYGAAQTVADGLLAQRVYDAYAPRVYRCEFVRGHYHVGHALTAGKAGGLGVSEGY